ncbi:hypothetical protein [Rhodovulum euryhalinum]|uniref:Uncharacterized protein n=1 Tax=Rhodovulum euryhalinum TaxID=35805 RepID=A0A4R2KKT3_9RHOB|nr:hypothetical protein [Rhodovulum euryhalinum]TCO73954.1 hypothetical protein EV655_101110 [Rhodovulum euryhalinum]
MRHVRLVLALSLALGLAVASLGLAAARGEAGPAGVVVVCTGMGLQTIAVDAEGNPVGPPHPCPDGLAALAVLALDRQVLPGPAESWTGVEPPRTATCRTGRTALAPRARGPPWRAA